MPRSPAKDLSIGLRRWNGLPLARRFTIAQRVVRLRFSQWLETYSGMVSAGVGHKLTRTPAQKRASRRLAAQITRPKAPKRSRGPIPWTLGTVKRDQICIRFVMEHKWTGTDAANNAEVPERIPSLIHTTTVIQGRRVRVSIPTDVDQHATGAVQAALDATDGIRVISSVNANNRCLGSFCCVVRNRQKPSERYLLSCHHVLTLSANSPTFSPVGRSNVRTRIPDVSSGELFDFATLGDGTDFGCDAALAELTVPDDPEIWGVAPTGIAAAFDRPTSLSVMVPRQNPTSSRRIAPIPAAFIDVQFGQLIPFNNNVAVRFEAVVRYRAETVEGDSGSAVIGSDGTLYGMHFYEFHNGIACAIPAYILFRPGLFSINIKL